MLDREIMEQFEKLAAMIEKMDAKIDGVESRLNVKIDALDAKIDGVETRLDAKIDGVKAELYQTIAASEQRMKIFIETRFLDWVNGIYESHLGTQEDVEQLNQRVTVLEQQAI